MIFQAAVQVPSRIELSLPARGIALAVRMTMIMIMNDHCSLASKSAESDGVRHHTVRSIRVRELEINRVLARRR
jgi:hypothetical protein